MKYSIIVEDKLVRKDGIVLQEIDMSSLDSSIRAIQFNETWGEIEYNNTVVDGVVEKPANQFFSDPNEFKTILDLFDAEKTRLDELEAQQNIPVVTPE